MALKMESYMALLAVTFAFIMVQMQITVDGQHRSSNNNTTNTTNTTYTTNTTKDKNNTGTGVTTSTSVTTGTGVTGAGTGVTGAGTGVTGAGSGAGVYAGMASYTSSSTSSFKTGCFQMLQHVLMALSFLQVIQ